MKRAAILRRSELRSKARPAPQKVTPDTRDDVFRRDNYRCLAPILAEQHDEPIDACKGRYGQRAIVYVSTEGPIYDLSTLTYEHVTEHAGIGQAKPPPVIERALTLCYHHNVNGWAQSHKRWEREHLAALYQ